MAVPFDTYPEDRQAGYAGMIANGEPSNRISRTIEDADGIAFGLPAYRGAGDHGCTGTVGSADDFYGFTIAHQALGLVDGQNPDVYPQHSNVALLTEGAIYVEVTGAVSQGDAITIGTGANEADGIGATAADATHIATGFVADETVTDGICRIVRR